MRARERERILTQLRVLTKALNDDPCDFDTAWDAIIAIRNVAKEGMKVNPR